MYQPSASASVSPGAASYAGESIAQAQTLIDDSRASAAGLLDGVRRRWRRERRRRQVGRAYDMACEIARAVPVNSRVLDVGCGSGFIAHHLSAMLGTGVMGIDVGGAAEAPIDYRQFDGTQFPVAACSVDAVLLCYVLHHAQDLDAILREIRRVLSDGGLAVIYEDIPGAWWDRFVCWTHDLKWRRRTGRCTFRSAAQWRVQFNSAGFEVAEERELSRWRNLAHPVKRRFFLLKLDGVTSACSASNRSVSGKL